MQISSRKKNSRPFKTSKLPILRVIEREGGWKLSLHHARHWHFCNFLCYKRSTSTSSPKKIELEVAGQTLDCYCVCCELLSASKADALRFVNMVCLPLIAEQNAHEICLTQECLQCWMFSCVRHISWAFRSAISGKQTMFTNRKASALEADNNSQHTQ